MCKRSTVDHEHEAAWPLAVVMSDELGHAGRDTLERVAIRVAWELAGDDTVLLQDPTLREELLDGVQHLRVDGYGAFASATNDDDVVITADEVRTVTNGYGANMSYGLT